MAIYSFHAQNISRGSGRSAVAAAAYRHRTVMVAQTTGQTFKFSYDEELVHEELSIPDNSPDWVRKMMAIDSAASKSEQFWNVVEASQTRTNATLAREIVAALPKELTREQNIALMRDYVELAFTSRGMVTDWVYHEKPGNPHVHIMLSMQPLIKDGLGTRFLPVLDANGNHIRKPDGKLAYQLWSGNRDTLIEWRSSWADSVNKHLELAGLDLRVDHRSLRDRGLDLKPAKHRGVNKAEAQHLDEMNEIIRAENEKKILADPMELVKLVGLGRSVFTEEDITRVAKRYLSKEEDLIRVTNDVMSSRKLVSTYGQVLDYQKGELEAKTIFARRDLVIQEQTMLEHSRALMLTKGHGLRPEQVEERIAKVESELGFTLSEPQRNAVLHVTGDNGIACVVGYAGAGKSTMLKAANEAWVSQGRRVFGASLSGKATVGLMDSSDIPSRTLAAWEYRWRQGRDELKVGDVFVIDEAGMVSSEQMAKFIKYADLVGAKVVLVGDPMQLQPIEAGAAFRAVSERIGHVVICDIRRQNEQWMRDASVNMALGDIGKAVDAYDRKGAVKTHEDLKETVKEMVADWDKVRNTGSTLMLAHSNASVGMLNASARNLRKEAGELENGITYQTSRGDREFAVGDRILYLKNEQDVMNGMFGNVVETLPDRLVVQLDGSGAHHEVKPSEYAFFDHGYAATIHKSQGATVDHALVLATRTMDQHLLYVGMSRHQDSVQLHVNGDDFKDRADFIKRMGLDSSSKTTLDYEGWLKSERKVSNWERIQSLLKSQDKTIELKAAAEIKPEVKTIVPATRTPAIEPSAGKKTEAKTVGAGKEQPYMIKPAEPDLRRSVVEVAIERTEKNPAVVKSIQAMYNSGEMVFREPKKALAEVERRILSGETIERTTDELRQRPEVFGELRGSDHVLSRFTKGAREREVALAGAGFTASQVEKAAVTRRETMRSEQALEGHRRERMVHGVPYLSDRAQGLLRAIAEKADISKADELAIMSKVKSNNPKLTAEIIAFDAALTRRFGPDAFTERSKESIDPYLSKDDLKKVGQLTDIATTTRRFTDFVQNRDLEKAKNVQETLPLEVRQTVAERPWRKQMDPEMQAELHAWLEKSDKQRAQDAAIRKELNEARGRHDYAEVKRIEKEHGLDKGRGR